MSHLQYSAKKRTRTATLSSHNIDQLNQVVEVDRAADCQSMGLGFASFVQHQRQQQLQRGLETQDDKVLAYCNERGLGAIANGY